MAASNEVDELDEFDKWGIRDAARQTRELRQRSMKTAGRFEFNTQNKKREVSSASCSLEEFALTKHVMQLVSRPNSATYLMENFNYNSVSEDFKKFIAFVETYPEPGNAELAALIFPIFVHFYILLLHSGTSGRLQAKAFFNNNKSVFDYAKSYDNILERLHSFRNIEDIKEDSYYKNFLTHKYIIGMSEDILQALQEFIEKDAGKPGEKSLLYVLHFHIYFQDNDEGESSENIKHDEDSKLDFIESITLEDNLSDTNDSSVIEDTSSDVTESLMHEDTKSDLPLEDLLKELNIMHPRISTVVTKCEKEELFSVDFNDDETEIAYAFGDNYIYLAPIEIKKKQMKRQIVEVSDSDADNDADDDDDDEDDETAKRQRFEEEKMEVVLVPHCSSSQKKGSNTKSVKVSKDTRIERTPNFSKSSESSNDAKSIDTDKKTHPVSGMKEFKMPGGEKVYVVKYLPGKPHHLLAVCNTTVKLFNTETSSFESDYTGDNAFIFDMDVNSTSQFFATANDNMESCLYSFNRSTPIRKFFGHENVVTTVRFHPNGLYIATGSDDNKIRLFDIENGLCCRSFVGHLFGVWTIAFSPDGKLLASGDSSGVVKTWDIKEGSEISEVCFTRVKETLARITSVCFHADSYVLTACNHKGEMKLWDVKDPEQLMVLNFTNIPLKIKFGKNGLWKIVFRNAS